MEYIDVKRDIESGKLAPVYFFFGEEPYYMDELTATVIRKTVTPESRDFNCDVFQSEEADASQVVAAAASVPMIAERRVVVLKSVQKLTHGDKEILQKYVQKPADSTSLVLTAGKIDRRQSFYASLVQRSRWIEFKPLYDNQAVSWVENRFRDKGFRIGHEAAGLLVQMTGNSLWNLANETEKVITFCWGKREIALGDVEDIAGFSRKHNVWELSDSFGSKNFIQAMTVLQRLIQEKQSPAGLIMELTRRVVQLIQIRVLMDKNRPLEAIRDQLGLSPYFLKRVVEQAGRFTLHELDLAVHSLLLADMSIKTGRMGPLPSLTFALHDLILGEIKGRFFQ